ncbi:enoyl-CoA hydratase-related protein [Vibrio sp. ZSDE26]|uniref:Enoyl-CoA hydratase-related protein n=1 Tax=Vibrio amylolyticus TaxID=2847292 RepID=A0A9X1XJS8_9VIBR|nr:enoyl-CoA hydratase-related protein [Vibrio amylolyticus]MCK6263415.1 enoyl-CoA hydratase-related protein [Vibrio amylolyticus]
MGVATLTLNRVDKHNAFDDELIKQLNKQLKKLARLPSLRSLILRANGRFFSSGADLNWMQSMADQSASENKLDADNLALLMQRLDNFPRPTIAVIEGDAFGGAIGLICCCDIAIATENAQFCFSEVKRGLVPATIAPYVCRTIGSRQARRYMLTAEKFNAMTAYQMDMLHFVVESSFVHQHEHQNREHNLRLDAQVQSVIHMLLSNSPNALKETKTLCLRCDKSPIDQELIDYTSQLIADIRISKQGQEGVRAFFAKRPPAWKRK